VAGPTRLFMATLPGTTALESLQPIFGTLTRIGTWSGALVLGFILVWWLRTLFWRQAPAHDATWGCGYDAPNTRMQYTGASFSTDFASHFSNIMVLLQRKKAPAGYFPSDSYVITDCVDAVERRMYSVIDHGNESATLLSNKLHEDDPRIAFSAGLAALLAIAAVLLLTEGALP